jgi:hypothetical protein
MIEVRHVGPWPGGWRYSDGALGVQEDELWIAYNVVFGNQGEVRKRPGYVQRSTNHPAWNTNQYRHYQLRLSSGDYYDVVMDAAGKYWDTAVNAGQSFTGSASSTTSSLTASADTFLSGACIYKDVMYLSSWRTNGVKSYDGSTFTNNANNVPSGAAGEFPIAKHLLTKHERVFAANVKVSGTAYRSRLYFSDAGEAQVWQAANYIDIEPDDGSQITALASFGEYVMIFKETSTFLLAGVDKQTFTLFPLDTTVGTISPYSVASSSTHLYWYDHIGDRIVRFNGSSIEPIDEKVKGFVDLNIAKATYVPEAVAAIWYRDHYLMSFQSGGSSKGMNCNTMVFNAKLGAWSYWPQMGFADATVDNTAPTYRGNLFLLNPAPSYNFNDDDGLLLMAWSDLIDDNAYADLSDAIDVQITTGWYGLAEDQMAQITARERKISIVAQQTQIASGNDLVVTVYRNYNTNDSWTNTFDMYWGAAYPPQYTTPGFEADFAPLLSESFLNSFALNFDHVESTDSLELWGADIAFTVRKRGQRRGKDA